MYRNLGARRVKVPTACVLLCSLLLAYFGITCCILPIRALAAEEATAPPADPQMMEVYAKDSAGNYLAHGLWPIDDEWHTFSSGDPLGLEAQGPLSRQPFEPAVCPPGVIITAVNSQCMLRPAGAATQCPYEAMHPSCHLYLAQLPNGSTLLLRLQASAEPATVQLVFEGQTINMQPAEPITVARVQLEGTTPKRDISLALPEDFVTRQDIRSLVAFTDGMGQDKALLDAAQIVVDLLANYQKRHGRYPMQLSELTADVDGVIYALPRNPYDWSVSLGVKPPTPALPYGVVYYPQLSALAGGEPKPTGYWLAVTGVTGDAQPTAALPEGTQAPEHVIRWLEQHVAVAP